jgi:hypothetical protein
MAVGFRLVEIPGDLHPSALTRWLSDQSRTASVVIAARTALRAFPLIVGLWDRPGFVLLPFFRIAQITWAYSGTLGGLHTQSYAPACRSFPRTPQPVLR